jgi:hypothetical protein
MTRKNALGLSYVWPRMQRIRPRVGHDLMRRLNFRVSPRWLATGRPMARSTARTPQPLGSNPPARRDGDTAARKEHGEKEMTKNALGLLVRLRWLRLKFRWKRFLATRRA